MLGSAIAAGVLAGLATGGSLQRLAALRVAWLPLLVAGALLRLAAPLAPFAPLPVYLASFAAIVAVAWRNRALPGAPLIGIGGAVNFVVVALNGGMPVDLDAAAAVGSSGPHDPLHVILGPDTKLAPLADVIPVPIIRSVYSVGDLLDAAGGFWLPFAHLRAAGRGA